MSSPTLLCIFFLSFAFHWRILAAISITEDVKGRNLIPGEEAKFTCSSMSGMPRWKFNGELLEDEEFGIDIIETMVTTGLYISILQMEPYTLTNEGTYMCFNNEENVSVVVTTKDYSLGISGKFPAVLGDSLDLLCTFECLNRDVESYRWSVTDTKGNMRTSITNDSTLSIPSVSEDDVGEYYCQVMLNTDVKLTTSANVTFLFPPVLDGPALVNKTLITNDDPTLQLPCNITGDSLQLSWTFEGAPISSSGPRYDLHESSGLLTVSDRLRFSDEGNYVCTGTNDAGSISKTYQITVLGAPEILTASNSLITVNEGNSLTVPCVYQSNPVPTLTLSHTPYLGSDITFVDKGRYSVVSDGILIQIVTVADNGMLYCNVSNVFGHQTVRYNITVYDVPSIPSGLSVTSIQSDSAVVSWNNGDQEPVFTKPDDYRLEVIGDGVESTYYTKSTTFNLTGLTPGAQYSVRVLAQNRAGSSSMSDNFPFTTLKSAPRFEYFNITSLDGGRSLQLNWKLMFDGGSPVTEFMVTITSSETQSINLNIEVSDALQGSRLVTNLEPNIVYSVQTSLRNSIDTSLVNYLATTARGPPSKPSKPQVSEIQIHSVQISFSIDSIGSESVEYYLVNISCSGSIQQVRFNFDHPHVLSVVSARMAASGQNVVLLINSLEGDSSYSFSVSAGGSQGNGPFSEYSDMITTDDGTVLYYIITGVVIGSLFIIAMIAAIFVFMYCVNRRRKRRISQKHTITDRLHEPVNFGFPNSSMSENVHIVEQYTPPSSSMEMERDDLPQSFPHHGYVKISNHQRNQSVSSTSSNQMYKKDFLKSPTESHALVADSSDSAYGGSAEKVPAHIYNEIPPRTQSVSASERTWFSSPSINRVTSYDVDTLPPKIPYVSDV